MTSHPSELPVSVVIPVFNRVDMVRRALDSVQRQTVRPREIIVVDDCSTDDTADVAEAMGASVIRHETNKGHGEARNTAIRAATQPWLALLDSDDEWLPHHLETVWALAPGHVMVAATGMVHRPDGGGRLIGQPSGRKVELTPAHVFFPENPVPTSSVLLDRATVLEVGAFRPLPRAVDIDLWARVLGRGRGVQTPVVTVSYHIHEGQVSVNPHRSQAAHAAVLESYRDTAWWSPALAERWQAVVSWDELRRLQREGDVSGAARAGASLLRSPRRALAAAQLLRWRRQLRQRTRVLLEAGL